MENSISTSSILYIAKNSSIWRVSKKGNISDLLRSEKFMPHDYTSIQNLEDTKVLNRQASVNLAFS